MASRLSHGKKNIFGPAFAIIRRKAGLRQSEVAARLQVEGWDVDNVVISYIEGGKRMLTDIELGMLLASVNADLADLQKVYNQNFSSKKK